MAFTRFNDDPCRIMKQLQESTDQGRYILNVPGNGDKPYYIDDPYIRLQGWGANLMTNSINIENELRGMTQPINKDCIKENNYKYQNNNYKMQEYPVISNITEQPRATQPAWLLRDVEFINTTILPLNPQENTTLMFPNNLNTRILEKDYYITKFPCNN